MADCIPYITYPAREEQACKTLGDTASSETEEETEEMTTSALVMSILQQLGCQPEVNEENHISFKYQETTFLLQPRTDFG